MAHPHWYYQQHQSGLAHPSADAGGVAAKLFAELAVAAACFSQLHDLLAEFRRIGSQLDWRDGLLYLEI